MAEPIQVNVWVAVDEDGEYEVARDKDDLDTSGMESIVRFYHLKMVVPLSRAVTIKAEIKDDGEENLPLAFEVEGQ